MTTDSKYEHARWRIAALAQAFETEANSYKRGFVKPWKANGIVAMLVDMPEEFSGKRLQDYMCNCLEMEGFPTATCIELAKWLEVEYEKIAV